MGVSLWLSALYVLYRDVQYIIPFLVQIWFYLSPVMYPTSKIPQNPLDLQPQPYDRCHRRVSVGLFGEQAPNALFWLSALMVLVFFVSGLVLLQAHGTRLRRPRMSTAINISGLGKRYMIGAAQKRNDTLRDAITSAAARRFAVCAMRAPRRGMSAIMWALRDVNFDVEAGQVIGIIGRNGAGKSTLLKILTRITEPTDGPSRDPRPRRQPARGRHRLPPGAQRPREHLPERRHPGHDASRDRAQVRRHRRVLRDRQFLDTPVKRYSTGMYVRLAFAVAAHLEPEILLVDEVLRSATSGSSASAWGRWRQIAGLGAHRLFREPQHGRRPPPLLTRGRDRGGSPGRRRSGRRDRGPVHRQPVADRRSSSTCRAL